MGKWWVLFSWLLPHQYQWWTPLSLKMQTLVSISTIARWRRESKCKICLQRSITTNKTPSIIHLKWWLDMTLPMEKTKGNGQQLEMVTVASYLANTLSCLVAIDITCHLTTPSLWILKERLLLRVSSLLDRNINKNSNWQVRIERFCLLLWNQFNF